MIGCRGRKTGMVWDWDWVLKITAATLLYAAITAGLAFLYRRQQKRKLRYDLMIGVVYGACAVACTHIELDHATGAMIQLRDVAPLCAGLFFSPASGIVSGVIGAAERFIAGQVAQLETDIVISDTLAACLAGFLAATLNKWFFKGKRPSVFFSVLIGAAVEAFHMYGILIFEPLSSDYARHLVQVIAVPMIVSTSLATALCSLAARTASGEKIRLRRWQSVRDMPVAIRYQRGLLMVTFVVLVVNFCITWGIQTNAAENAAAFDMGKNWYNGNMVFEDTGDILETEESLRKRHDAETFFLLADSNGYAKVIMKGIVYDAEPADVDLIRGHIGEGFFSAPMEFLGGVMCVFYSEALDSGHVLAVFRLAADVYEMRDGVMYENTLSDVLLFTVLYFLIIILTERLVVRNLGSVNVSLEKITHGQLNERVKVYTSSEFTSLSVRINETVTALRGYIDAAEKRMEEELKLAAQIQDAALPKNFNLPTDHLELYALMTPARQVGGDFYDFFSIGPEKLCLVIADVSGKGVPAAMFMMRAKTAIKYYARSGNGPAKLLEHVNNALCEDNDADMFVTVWLGILNLKTGVMRCASAGHEYPALMRSGGGYELVRYKHGLMLAAFRDIRMKEYEIALNPGDRLFVYTDGVPEAMNVQQEQYGPDRMVQALTALKDRSQEEMLKGVLRDIRSFAGEAEQFDDITMLGITYR